MLPWSLLVYSDVGPLHFLPMGKMVAIFYVIDGTLFSALFLFIKNKIFRIKVPESMFLESENVIKSSKYIKIYARNIILAILFTIFH